METCPCPGRINGVHAWGELRSLDGGDWCFGVGPWSTKWPSRRSGYPDTGQEKVSDSTRPSSSPLMWKVLSPNCHAPSTQETSWGSNSCKR